MNYMVIETFKYEKKAAVYRRFKDKGRMLNQNHDAVRRKGVIDALQKNGTGDQLQIAKLMTEINEDRT